MNSISPEVMSVLMNETQAVKFLTELFTQEKEYYEGSKESYIDYCDDTGETSESSIVDEFDVEIALCVKKIDIVVSGKVTELYSTTFQETLSKKLDSESATMKALESLDQNDLISSVCFTAIVMDLLPDVREETFDVVDKTLTEMFSATLS